MPGAGRCGRGMDLPHSLRAFIVYERNGEHVDQVMSGCRDGRKGGGPTLRSLVREMRCFMIVFLIEG